MKFRGKAITGASLLMVLGVMCTATIVMAAVVLLGQSAVQPTKTVSDSGLTVTIGDFTGHGGTQLSSTSTPAEATPYLFQAYFNTTNSASTGYYQIAFTGTGAIAPGSVTIQYWDGSAWSSTGVSNAFGSSTVTVTITTTAPVGFASGANAQGFEVTYNNAGTYAMQVFVYTP